VTGDLLRGATSSDDAAAWITISVRPADEVREEICSRPNGFRDIEVRGTDMALGRISRQPYQGELSKPGQEVAVTTVQACVRSENDFYYIDGGFDAGQDGERSAVQFLAALEIE
jgi:hypothetical protein